MARVSLSGHALFVTPVRSVEVLLGKTVPYFILGMIGLALSVIGLARFDNVSGLVVEGLDLAGPPPTGELEVQHDEGS